VLLLLVLLLKLLLMTLLLLLLLLLDYPPRLLWAVCLLLYWRNLPPLWEPSWG
jgi:hypothetical protein